MTHSQGSMGWLKPIKTMGRDTHHLMHGQPYVGALGPMGLYGPIVTLWNGGADQLKFPADHLKLHGFLHFTKETCVCGFKMSKKMVLRTNPKWRKTNCGRRAPTYAVSLMYPIGVCTDSKFQEVADDMTSYFNHSNVLKEQPIAMNLPPGTMLLTADTTSMYTNIQTCPDLNQIV